jgi:hypothetical protein
MHVTSRTPVMRELWRFFPRMLPMPWLPPAINDGRIAVSPPGPDRLRAVFAAVDADKLPYETFVALCAALVQMRNDLANHTQDRQSERSPQRRAARYHGMAALLTKVLELGGAELAGEQVFDDFVAAIEGGNPHARHQRAVPAEVWKALRNDVIAAIPAVEDEDPDADAMAREHLAWFQQIPAVVQMLSTAAALAQGEKPRSSGRSAEPLALVIGDICALWKDTLGRPLKSSVDPVTHAVGGSFICFASACCALLGIDASRKAIRAAARYYGYLP